MNTVARGARRNIGRFHLLWLKPRALDDLWILGTGPENDEASYVADVLLRSDAFGNVMPTKLRCDA